MKPCPSCGEPNPLEARFCQSCGGRISSQEAAEVRKLASMVFCDVTGSTALGERLDPEVLRQLITRYFEDMRVVLTRHGGTVEKFIGDAVMAVFGVPVVHEDDAVRAVRAAHEMRELVNRIVTPGDGESGALQVRIGVNTGDVIAGDATAGHGFVSGDAVNVAARLEQAAAPGQILIGESTYRLAADWIEADLVPPLEVKGKSEPLRAYELLGIKSQQLFPRRSTKLVGRSEELAELANNRAAVASTASPKWVTVVGDAGVGKTALVDTFLETNAGTSQMMIGRCLSYGEGITFWPVTEAIKQAAGIAELDGSREEATAKLESFLRGAPDAELLIPRLSAAIGLTQEIVSAQEFMWAVRVLLEHLARQKPVVLVIEDAHWAEPTLLDLVEYLANFMREAAVMLVVVGRRELLEKRPEWLARTTVVAVEPLAEPDVKELIRTILSEEALPDQIETQVLAAGQGNPLYVQEILKMLLEQELIQRRGGQWQAAAEFAAFEAPRTIQALLAARLERLPHEERGVVQRGAVIGKSFWFGAVSELTDPDHRAEIGRALQSLVRKEELQPDSSDIAGEDSFRFEQTLMRDTAYKALPKLQRAALHEKVASWLTERAGDRLREYENLLGYHLEQAVLLRRSLGTEDDHTRGLAERAGALLASSGRRALASGDLPAAVGYLRRALPLTGESAEGSELRLDLATALTESGELRSAGAMVAEVLTQADNEQNGRLAARARLHQSTIRSMTDYDGWMQTAGLELPSLLEEFDSFQDPLGKVRAMLLLADYHWDNLRTSKAQEVLTQALPIARDLGDNVEEGRIESFLAAVSFWGPMPVPEAIALCEGVSSSRPDDRLLQAKCLRSLSGLYAMKGDFDQARRLAASSRELHLELGQLLSLAHSSQYFGVVELLAGNPDKAADLFRGGFESLQRMGEEAFLSTQAAYLARALLQAGKVDDAYAMTLTSQELADDGESSVSRVEWGPTRIRILAQRADLQEAANLAQGVIEAVQQAENVIDAGNAFTAIAELFGHARQLDQARTFFEDAHRIYAEKGVEPLASEVRARLEGLPHTAG